MPVKRRNGGRSKKNRGHTRALPCLNCGRLVPKDKAIKRYHVRDIVDASSKRDISEALAVKNMKVPKLYLKQEYCISCAIHARIVRVRSVTDRKIRVHARRQQKPQQEKKAN